MTGKIRESNNKFGRNTSYYAKYQTTTFILFAITILLPERARKWYYTGSVRRAAVWTNKIVVLVEKHYKKKRFEIIVLFCHHYGTIARRFALASGSALLYDAPPSPIDRRFQPNDATGRCCSPAIHFAQRVLLMDRRCKFMDLEQACGPMNWPLASPDASRRSMQLIHAAPVRNSTPKRVANRPKPRVGRFATRMKVPAPASRIGWRKSSADLICQCGVRVSRECAGAHALTHIQTFIRALQIVQFMQVAL